MHGGVQNAGPGRNTLDVLTADPFPAGHPEIVDTRLRSDYIRLRLAVADPASWWVDRDARLRLVNGAGMAWPVIPPDGRARWYSGLASPFSNARRCEPCVICWNSDAALAADLLAAFETQPREIQAIIRSASFVNRILPMPTGFIHLCASAHGRYRGVEKMLVLPDGVMIAGPATRPILTVANE